MGRVYVPAETRLVAEWVQATFPAAHVVFRARLGAYDKVLRESARSEAHLRALGVWRRYVDALVLGDTAVHLVEGKMRGTPGALEQLDLYLRLWPLTPEYRGYVQLPVTRDLVWVIPDPVIEAMARERGIQVHTFAPAWTEAYFATGPANRTAPPLPGGLLDGSGPGGTG